MQGMALGIGPQDEVTENSAAEEHGYFSEHQSYHWEMTLMKCRSYPIITFPTDQADH